MCANQPIRQSLAFVAHGQLKTEAIITFIMVLPIPLYAAMIGRPGFDAIRPDSQALDRNQVNDDSHGVCRSELPQCRDRRTPRQFGNPPIPAIAILFGAGD
ncbi:MAG: hypothetical protein GY938_04045 [Ketobacter sp.]|nr:hypothetical protein [Ketobacter sp.]